VYDYVAGKQDWLARALPTEGEKADVPIAGDVAREDAVTCQLEERVGAVRERVDKSPHSFALVVSKTGVLLGRLGATALAADPNATAEDAMEAGPSTVRPGEELAPLIERLRKRDLRYALVTMPDGALVGVLLRSDAEERLAG
jgi:Mg/Co/Ni transporter MgtE